ncbi:hypothetical protein K461DRAFT_313203 [Myriangium duriaei CBS 260.36]|uniref:Uncharacterized protein n=1 Tax=Myriangium duriaei CBS 260.36 TaxID=1168546 RepID=A0A9P4J171_9PEZI|nr:hypothetical protein K461DRAFT_313203 [Myriangium duriaei CBS 260.36]
MPATPMPWLADLPDEWVAAPPVCAQEAVRRSSLASISSVKQCKDASGSQSGSVRQGLKQLNENSQNARAGFSSVRGASVKGTVQSVDSVVRYDTVERQSSPAKKESDMEWKRRLVDGDLGYGDQTDLFGPSALENIFQSPSKPSSATKGRPSNLKHSEAIPSSPPPWPTSLLFKQRSDVRFPSLSHHEEESEVGDSEVHSKSDESGSILREDAENVNLSVDQSEASSHNDQTGSTDRKVSGQTEIGNETFSPVFISKHTTLNGEINYTPLDSETARIMKTSSMASTHTVQNYQGDLSGLSRDTDNEYLPTFDENILHVEVSLPDNLPTGTPPVSKLGNFVTVQRGGLSNYGSFRTRPLSPSGPDSRKPSVTFKSVEAEDVYPTTETNLDARSEHEPTTHSLPQTPTRDVSAVPELLNPRSSGSPLKLFGVYDTFTNRKLLRRLSQLEDSGEKPVATKEVLEEESLLQDANVSHLQSEEIRSPVTTNIRAQSTLDNFGEHEIDEIDFEANLSFPSENYHGSDNRPNEQRSPSGSPEPGVLPPGAMSPFMFHVDDCDDPQESFGVKRKLSDRSTNKSRRPESSPRVEQGFRTAPHAGDSIRSRGSPTKLPTPKRQRTLHHLDIEMERLTLDADQGDEDEEDENSVLPALRAPTQIRPRNPTPSQQRQHENDDLNLEMLSSSPKLRTIRDQIEESSLPGSIKLVSQAKVVASEMAAFTLNVAKHDIEAGERKRSITTQDFLDEAMHIMSLIRARGRPNQSGLGSVEESNEESSIADEEPEPSEVRSPSVLRVSRPPSREGIVSGWRPRSQPNQDPKAESQLKRYQEKDDMEILDATFHSLKLKGLVEEEYSELSDGSIGEIRISGPIQQDDEFESDPFEDYDERPGSMGSQGSENYSTGRTQGTSSTHKSDNVATLAPETVAHLIPEEVAGMTFDRTQGKWVRMKPERPTVTRRQSECPGSNLTSDDDPFNNIPDLTVDEMEEQERVRTSQVSKHVSSDPAIRPLTERGHARYSSRDETTFVRPDSGHSRMQTLLKSSTAPGHPMMDSSQAHIETRATSWATEHQTQARKSTKTFEPNLSTVQQFETIPGRTQTASTTRSRSPKSADLQQFSSEPAHRWDEQESDVEELPPRQASARPQARKVSFQAQSFRQRRFGQDVDQSELSIVAELPDKRLMSVSVAVSRPVRDSNDDLQLTIHDDPLDQSSLILSDLPDFTVADIDNRPGPSERNLAATVACHGKEVEGDRYALAVQDLVKTLTDIKGDEPFWEDIKQLDLKCQSLNSLHGLEDFCTRVQQLDVSGNALSHLEGAPYAVRWLNASRNALSSLTGWNQLVNLQYLDISHNQITSLDGVGCLMHLRELKADHNQISSMSGLRDLDGLLKLNVSHNEIASVDFSRCNWTRLEELDLSSNRIHQVTSITGLPALKKFVLDDNTIAKLLLGKHSDESCQLQYLSASNNKIQTLDLTSVSSLRYLDLDCNSISSLSGLSSLKQLDLLSLRRQTYTDSLHNIWDTTFSSIIYARTVNLSGNTFPDTLTIQTTQNTISNLELSSCGLLTLPSSFGLHFPNLSSLNLNFNALKDIRPLLNIQRLTTLHLAGNRLARLRKCIETLAHLKGLTEVDLRENPFSVGFYAPLGTEGQLVRAGQAEERFDDVQRRKARPYLLPGSSGVSDGGHWKTLDEDTRLRRRVHEILLVSGCREVRSLDGLEVKREKVLEKDAAWRRLRELGVLKPRSV